jgi:hypothetical protein
MRAPPADGSSAPSRAFAYCWHRREARCAPPGARFSRAGRGCPVPAHPHGDGRSHLDLNALLVVAADVFEQPPEAGRDAAVVRLGLDAGGHPFGCWAGRGVERRGAWWLGVSELRRWPQGPSGRDAPRCLQGAPPPAQLRWQLPCGSARCPLHRRLTGLVVAQLKTQVREVLDDLEARAVQVVAVPGLRPLHTGATDARWRRRRARPRCGCRPEERAAGHEGECREEGSGLPTRCGPHRARRLSTLGAWVFRRADRAWRSREMWLGRLTTSN